MHMLNYGMYLTFLVFGEMSAHLYDHVKVCRFVQYLEFSGDREKPLEAPLSHNDHCSRKGHLLDLISPEVTLHLSCG